MAGMDHLMLQFVEHLAKNEIQDAKKAAIACCANDTTKKNKGEVEYYKRLLENGNYNSIEIPADLQGILKNVDVSDFREDRYYLNQQRKMIFEQIEKADKVYTKMLEFGIHYNNTTLLYGLPGVGKTEFAKYVAYKMGLPYMYLNFSYVIDSYLGKTSRNIERVFEYCKGQKCVLMLDEIDCIGMLRGGKGVDGELSRITITLMQCLDSLADGQIVIAATNREDILDKALQRRFHNVSCMYPYTVQDTKEMMKQWINSIPIKGFKYEEYMDVIANTNLYSTPDEKKIFQSSVIDYLKNSLSQYLIKNEIKE